VRHMEKSNHLRQAQIVAETVTTNSSDQSAGGGNIQFDIAALYVPNAAESDDTGATEGDGGKKAATSEGSAAQPGKAGASHPAGARNTNGVPPTAPGRINSAQNRPVPPGRSEAR